MKAKPSKPKPKAKRKHHPLPSAWSKDTRGFFRMILRDMRGLSASQSLVAHPKAAIIPRAHWETLVWNFAWIAADLHHESQ